MGMRADVIVFEQDRVAAKIARKIAPDVTVICYDVVQLYNLLELPVLPCANRTRILKGGINFNLFESILAQTDTSIFGIDLTARTRFSFPIRTQRPRELGFLIELLYRFIKYRDLQCFALTIVIPSTTIPTTDDMTRMFSSLEGWKLIPEVVDSARIGDPISAHRVVITGLHPKVIKVIPESKITNRRSSQPTYIIDHLNVNLNTKLCALAEIKTQDLNNANISCHRRSPRPIALAQSEGIKALDNRDLVMHTAYPGVECDSKEWTAERQSFLIPYQCSLTSRTSIRALHSSEVLALYTASVTQELRHDLYEIAAEANICPVVNGSCPWETGRAVAEFVIDAALNQDMTDKEDTQLDIVRCHLVQPAPTSEDWKDAYREDRETNFILARMKLNTDWQERELHSVHRSFRPAIRENRMRIQSGRLVITNIGIQQVSHPNCRSENSPNNNLPSLSLYRSGRSCRLI